MDAVGPGAGASTACHVCGRRLDPAAEICPRCGVPQDPRPVTGSRGQGSGARGVPPVSLLAALLAIASALVGSVVYVTTFPEDPAGIAPWGYALGWGVPLAVVGFAYLGRRVDARLAAGIFLGAGMAQFFGWLPNLFGPGADFAWWIWASIVSGLLAIAGGLVAATAQEEPRKAPVGIGGPAAGMAADGAGDVARDGLEPGVETPPAPPPPPRFPWTPPDAPTKPCFACGHPLDPRAEICPACGSRQRPETPETPETPA